MDSEIIAAAILAAGFAAGHRTLLHAGTLEDAIREKFIEYYAFVREQRARANSHEVGEKQESPAD